MFNVQDYFFFFSVDSWKVEKLGGLPGLNQPAADVKKIDSCTGRIFDQEFQREKSL